MGACPQAFDLTCWAACRVCTGPEDAGERPAGGHVHRWGEEVVPHKGEDEEEGLGQHGEHYS